MLWLCLRKVILKIIRRFRQCFFWDIHVSGEHLGVKRKRFLKRIIATTDFCNGKGGYTDCPIRGRAEGATTAYDLLSFNECDRSQFTNTTGGKYGLCFAQAFQTVSDNFHVIPDVTHNVVVPYGQATELLDMLHRGELSEKISVLRRLQEYTVSLFDDDYRDLARKHAISLANEDFGVFLLNEEYYNDKYGVVREAEMPLLLM